MNNRAKEVLAKKCRLCGEVKKESQFRYIKYFRKRRVICKRCEGRERQKKRRLVERHVKEHGVTPGIRRRLDWEVWPEAWMKARETVLSGLTQEQARMYRWAQRVSRLCSIGLTLSVFFALFALARGFYGWLALPLLTGGGAVVVRRYFNRRHADPIDAEIKKHQSSIYQVLFQEALQQRIEDERFYGSPEWKILREAFLRTQRKLSGHYVCHYCQKRIWYDVTIDHFRPRSKFPKLALEMSNLRLACRSCNSSKGDTVSDEEFQL